MEDDIDRTEKKEADDDSAPLPVVTVVEEMAASAEVTPSPASELAVPPPPLKKEEGASSVDEDKQQDQLKKKTGIKNEKTTEKKEKKPSVKAPLPAKPPTKLMTGVGGGGGAAMQIQLGSPRSSPFEKLLTSEASLTMSAVMKGGDDNKNKGNSKVRSTKVAKKRNSGDGRAKAPQTNPEPQAAPNPTAMQNLVPGAIFPSAQQIFINPNGGLFSPSPVNSFLFTSLGQQVSLVPCSGSQMFGGTAARTGGSLITTRPATPTSSTSTARASAPLLHVAGGPSNSAPGTPTRYPPLLPAPEAPPTTASEQTAPRPTPSEAPTKSGDQVRPPATSVTYTTPQLCGTSPFLNYAAPGGFPIAAAPCFPSVSCLPNGQLLICYRDGSVSRGILQAAGAPPLNAIPLSAGAQVAHLAVAPPHQVNGVPEEKPTEDGTRGPPVTQSLAPSLAIPSPAEETCRPRTSENGLDSNGGMDMSDMPPLILGEKAVGPSDVDIRKLFLQEVERREPVKPGILSHVIDGFLIQESVEPFTVNAYPYEDYIPPEAFVDWSSVHDSSAFQPPELKPEVEQHFSDEEVFEVKETVEKVVVDKVEKKKIGSTCAQCNCKVAAGEAWKKDERFCSKSCSKKQNSERKRNRSQAESSRSGPESPKSPKFEAPQSSSTSKRWEVVLSPTKNGPEEPPEAPAPEVAVPLPPPDVNNCRNWTVEEVERWVRSLNDGEFDNVAAALRSQEMDGQALLLLEDRQLMAPPLEIKLGPVLKFMKHLKALQPNRDNRFRT